LSRLRASPSSSDTHNYGYKPVSAGLADWRDPAVFLARWVERTKPLQNVTEAIARAKKERDLGYSTWAIEYLERTAKGAKSDAGAEQVAATAKEWRKDAAFKLALQAEAKFVQAEGKALASKKGGKEKAAKLWTALLAKYGDTPLKARIEVAMAR
jgi:hypothetical protein